MEDKQIGFCEWLPGEMIVNFEQPIHLKCRCEHFSHSDYYLTSKH